MRIFRTHSLLYTPFKYIFHNLLRSDLFTEKVEIIIIVGNTRNRKLDTVAKDNKMEFVYIVVFCDY